MNLSFNNDPALKALHVAQAEQHAAQDMLLSGTYGDTQHGKFRGCSVGCFAHEIDPSSHNHHQVVAEARGLPEWLIRLQDSMFEGLPAADRSDFHVELARRIPVGVDLASVPHLIAVARIDRLLDTQRQLLTAGHPEQVTTAIQQVITALEVGRRAHEAAAGGDSCQLSSARSAAWSASAASAAARSAAWSASAASAAAWSARSAAESARSAAESAWSAAESAWSAAESARSAAESAAARSAAESAWSAAESARSAAESAAWKVERDALFAALASLEPQA